MKKTAFLIATLVFGDKLPYFGTLGSFISLPIVFLGLWISNFSQVLYFLLVITVLFLGVWSVPIAEKMLGPRRDPRGKVRETDQNQIGIDETLGMLISSTPLLFVVKLFWWHFLLTFVIFRFFDIAKIFPAKYFDKMHNPWGVMLDDVVAGIYSALCLYLILSFL